MIEQELIMEDDLMVEDDEYEDDYDYVEEEVSEDYSTFEEAEYANNKICPVSGQLIANVGDGKGLQMEYDGKIYNFCCSMCSKDFKMNPEKFIKKVNSELEESKARELEISEDYENYDDEEMYDGVWHRLRR